MKKYLFLLALTLNIAALYSQKVLTLQDALQVANAMSPTIRTARLSLEQYQENLNAERAALKSNFSLNIAPIGYSNQNSYNGSLGKWIKEEAIKSNGAFNIVQPIVATDGIISVSNNLNWSDNYLDGVESFKGFVNNLSLTIDQPVFTYNRKRMNIRLNELALEKSRLNYELKMLSVEKSVTQTFYDVYQAQKSLTTSNEDLSNRVKSFEIIKNKVDAGLVAKEEFFQAELDMLTSKSTVQDNEVTLADKLDLFKQLLGIPLDEDIVVLTEVSVNPVIVNLKEAISKGLASRMELRQNEIAIEEGLFNIIRTNSLNEFMGNVSVTLGRMNRESQTQMVPDAKSGNQDISFDLTIPLYDWGEKRARLKAAQAQQNNNVLDLENERTDISLTIRQVYRNLANLLIQIEIAQKNLENAQLTYDINLEKYKNGDLTSMDLNLVQNQLTQKKQSLTNAQIQYKLELLNLKIQTLYDFEKNVSIVPDFTKN